MIRAIPNQRLSVLLNELKVSLAVIYGDRLFSVILFGSQARGEAAADSDVDVMAVLDDSVNVIEERSRLSDMSWHYLMKYNELVSIVPMSKARFLAGEISFLRVVKREGVEI
jgi:predicted nucleotidyltransferase